MHGSEDVPHHKAYFASEDTSPFDKEDFGRYLHGSEDVAHHGRWYQMLQSLEQEESRRQNAAHHPREGTKEEQAEDERQEEAQEKETSYWQERLAEEKHYRSESPHFYQ